MQMIFSKEEIDAILKKYGNISKFVNEEMKINMLNSLLTPYGYNISNISLNNQINDKYVMDLSLPIANQEKKIIRKVKIFSNHTKKSIPVEQELIRKLHQNGFIISDDDNFDLAIAIGGDGSFLHMVHDCDFSDSIYYIGINTGTLGFAQEIYPNELDYFLKSLAQEEYKIEEIGIQETKIYTNNDIKKKYSLNELVIRDSNLKTVYLDIKVNNKPLEVLVGDGLIIATSFGSTAQNKSYKGSLVYNEFHTLQLTPMGMIQDNLHKNVDNSIVLPESRIITVTPIERSKKLLLTVDGENTCYDDISHIDTSIKKKRIKCMRMKDYDYTRKINEKFVEN